MPLFTPGSTLPGGLLGRLGGVHVVSRRRGFDVDDLFVTAYAPQETDDVALRQAFFQALLDMAHAVPARTRAWVMGDFNGHGGLQRSALTATAIHWRKLERPRASYLQTFLGARSNLVESGRWYSALLRFYCNPS